MKKRLAVHLVALLVFYLACASRSQAPTFEEFLPSGEQLELFDGQTFDFWDSGSFPSSGKVEIKDGAIILQRGAPLTVLSWRGIYRSVDYELQFEVKRFEGDSVRFGMVLPIQQSFVALMLGETAELCCLDGASQKIAEKTKLIFDTERWHPVRLRVTAEHIQAWVDDQEVVDQSAAGRQFSLPRELVPAAPIAVMTQNATAAVRNIILTLF